MGKCVELEIEAAVRYLEDGGIGEVLALVDVSASVGVKKVQMDVSLARGLCALADEALYRRTKKRMRREAKEYLD